MMAKHNVILAAGFVAALSCASVTANAAVITFESTPTGAQAEGFTAVGEPGIQFFSVLGAGLEVGDFTPQSDGQSLLVRNDTNGNFLKGVLTGGPETFLSLTFGNDDADFTIAGDLATLTTYLGATLVGVS